VTRTPEELSQIALEVAREAAGLLMKGFRSRPQAAEKARADLVTEWDLESERLIRKRLSERAPELGLVAEEGGGEKGSGPVFYCDPLDGTTNFVHGHPFFAVSIGVLESGVPIAGAVVAPCLGLVWQAHRGGRAKRNGEPCRVSETSALSESLLATGFPSDRSREPESNLETFVRVKKQARGIRRCGSAAIDLCLVADGTYDGYWERHLNGWDLAGGAAVVLAAGGRLTALDGGRVVLEVGQIVASNGRIHEALLGLIQNEQ
jgi:myo-inositol-1(or 4)-monophosphatase